MTVLRQRNTIARGVAVFALMIGALAAFGSHSFLTDQDDENDGMGRGYLGVASVSGLVFVVALSYGKIIVVKAAERVLTVQYRLLGLHTRPQSYELPEEVPAASLASIQESRQRAVRGRAGEREFTIYIQCSANEGEGVPLETHFSHDRAERRLQEIRSLLELPGL